MRKLIITGGTGFVGSNLIKFFQTNYSEVSLYLLNFRQSLPTTLEPADSIIHLAGMAHDVMNSTKDDVYFEVNYEKTKKLFQLFLKSDCQDFIYFSSVKAVADKVEGELFENSVANPLTSYGKSKLAAEQFLLNQILPEGRRLFILRPCMIHGPGNKGNLNLLYNFVKGGIPYPLGAFDNKRSFLSIDNLRFILERLLLDKSINGGVYNVADDIPLSTNQIISLIRNELHKKTYILHPSKKIIKLIAKIGDYLPLPLNSERLNKLTESYIVNNKKIKTALNIDGLPVAPEIGLIKTISSFN